MTITKRHLMFTIIFVWLAGITAYLAFALDSTTPTVTYEDGSSTTYRTPPKLKGFDSTKEDKPSDDSCITYDGNFDNDTC